MPFQLTDKYKVSKQRMTAEEAYQRAVKLGAYDLPFLKEFFEKLYDLCAKKGYDFANIVSQSANETGNWNSALWRAKRNPGGIGKTGTDISTGADLSITYHTGTEAALAMFIHTHAYVDGPIYPDQTEVYPYLDLDPRYTNVLQGKDVQYGSRLPLVASVKTIGDYNVNGRWAELVNSKYGNNIVARGNELFPNIPNQAGGPTPVPTTTSYDYSNGVMPSLVKYNVAESKKYAGYISPANHIIRGFFIHSAYGYLESTAGYFANGNALTDFMVGNALDGAAGDGKLYQFNDPNGSRFCYASGPVNNPIGDAAKFLEIYGPNPEVINMFTTALERTCTNTGAGAVTEKEHRKRVELIAAYANKYGEYLFNKTGKHLFTCDTFPLIPSENNRSFLIYHGENNEDKRETCPDKQVRATIDRIINDAKVLLTSWQRGGGTSTPPIVDPPVDQPGQYAPVKPIPGLEAYRDRDKDVVPAFVTIGSDTFIFVNDRVRALRNTPRYQSANTSGLKIGQDIEKGTEFAVNWLFWNDKGEAWYISPYQTRIFVSDTERIKDQA